MKKLLMCVLLIPLTFFGCTLNSDNMIIKEEYTDDYVEVIPDEAVPFIDNIDGDEVLLRLNDIENYNKKIMYKTDSMYEISNITKLSKEEILDFINSYKIPNLPKYDGNSEITNEQTKIILENRNIEEVTNLNNIQKGIIVNRSNLKSFPTNIHFYDEKNMNNFDNLQESELHINTPVLILHESKDKEWYFILTNTYFGWVKKDDVALSTEEDFNYFINDKSFAIITTPILEIDDDILDMSVKLPYISSTKDSYKLVLPKKDKNGYVSKKYINVSKNNANVGYLPYTKRNIYIQAIKYKDINYSWGGMDKGVDCSSYVSNVYRTFGFMFPRNTLSQNNSVGNIISLSNLSNKEKLDIIKFDYPSLLYQPGHVMIYLGIVNNKHYIVHASGSTMKVTLEELTEDSKYLSSIDRTILIE